MSARSAPLFFDAIVRVDRLHPPGRKVAVTTDAQGLAQLADILKVSSIDAFSATATVAPFRGGLRVLGQVHASLTQPSVVSFEPVIQDIAEPIDRIFMPSAGRSHAIAPSAELFVDLEDDVPDELDGPELDLTDLLVETVALAIDPYPRAPGETLHGAGLDLDDGVLSPFSGLKPLKAPDDGR